MSVCDNFLGKDIQMNCKDPISKGLEKVGIIINYNDIDFSAIQFSETNGNIIEALPLKSGKKAFSIYQQNNPFSGTKSTAEVGTAVNTVAHEISFVVLDKGPDVAETVIDPILFGGEFVVIVENKYKGLQKAEPGSAAFQIIGIHQGAKMSAGECDKYSDDTLSGWSITLKEEKVPKSEMYLFKTNYAATKQLIQTLINGTSVA